MLQHHRKRERNLSTIGGTHLRSTSGLEGTPPGVFTVTGWDRVPSPFLVRAATYVGLDWY